jgi:hypothetical protein
MIKPNRESYLGHCTICGCLFSQGTPVLSGFPLCCLHADMAVRDRIDGMLSGNAEAARHCRDIIPGEMGDGRVKYKRGY